MTEFIVILLGVILILLGFIANTIASIDTFFEEIRHKAGDEE